MKAIHILRRLKPENTRLAFSILTTAMLSSCATEHFRYTNNLQENLLDENNNFFEEMVGASLVTALLPLSLSMDLMDEMLGDGAGPAVMGGLAAGVQNTPYHSPAPSYTPSYNTGTYTPVNHHAAYQPAVTNDSGFGSNNAATTSNQAADKAAKSKRKEDELRQMLQEL